MSTSFYRRLQSFARRTSVIRRADFITFTESGFASSPTSLAEYSAKTYVEVRLIRTLLSRYLIDSDRLKGLEIGCGYGRLSPWIAEFGELFCIEPNAGAMEQAKRQHPQCYFVNGVAQQLPFEASSLDFVVTWTVLQHIPPSVFDTVACEIRRVLRDSGTILIAENVVMGNHAHVWERKAADYEAAFGMKLVHSEWKPVERNSKFQDAPTHPTDMVMVFRGT